MRLLLATMLLLLLGSTTGIAAVDRQDSTEIAHGRYLATLGDCGACHTNPGGKPYAGGRPIATPFGTLLAPNLTPDRDTGIGAWSDDDFIAAVRDGVGHGGERLYPAMPYTYYTRMSRDDVAAIRAYLATLEPVTNHVKSNQLPFPFDIRTGMDVWDWLYFSPGEFKPVTGKSPEWNRGAYLVEGPAHCGLCHTPKNFLGSDENSQALQGSALQGWFAPDVTGAAHQGLGGWTVDDIAAYLKTGHNRFSAATGPMSEVITDSTSRMTDADLRAVAVYLHDQTAAPAETASAAPDDKTMHAGAAIYVDNCAACHYGNGSGSPGLFPNLQHSAMVQSADPTDLIRIVLEGTRSVATTGAPTGPAMPTFGWKLSNAEIASVLSYIRHSWGNSAAPVSADAVASQRQSLARGED